MPTIARPRIIIPTPARNSFSSDRFFTIGRYAPPANVSTAPTIANTRKLSRSVIPNADCVRSASVASKLANAKIARK